MVETNPDKAKAMYNAIRNGDIDELVQSLKQLNMKNPIITKWNLNSGTNPLSVLQYTAYRGELDMFKKVSSTVTELNPKSRNGDLKGATPLHYAAWQGTVCRLRFKKKFKYFNRDPHRIVSYGLNVENKHSFKS